MVTVGFIDPGNWASNFAAGSEFGYSLLWVVTLSDVYKRQVGGPFYITQLSIKVASSAHIEYHARIIAQKSLARELITFTSNIQSKAFDETLDVLSLIHI